MKIVMTLMVRDEADIIAAMLEHHLAQGVDLIIVTDNGSTDGTREILEAYSSSERIEVRDYLEHDKNQSLVVTGMARDAATLHGADWVLNADADEFFLPRDPALTLHDAFQDIPTSLGSFTVPVFNMTGRPARSGGGLSRLLWQDRREEGSLMDLYALHAHPTANAIHAARPDVTVSQGNHSVDIESHGQPNVALMIDVLHYPWRSYAQYSTKILNTGLAYTNNPRMNPSPRHHGMRDYRFLRAGLLEHFYLVRHPGEDPGPDFIRDDRVVSGLSTLLERGAAFRPDLLAEGMRETDEHPYSAAERAEAQRVARIAIPLEKEHIAAATAWRDLYRGEARGRREAEERLAQVETNPDPLLVRARRAAGRAKRGVLRRARRLSGRPSNR